MRYSARVTLEVLLSEIEDREQRIEALTTALIYTVTSLEREVGESLVIADIIDAAGRAGVFAEETEGVDSHVGGSEGESPTTDEWVLAEIAWNNREGSDAG